MANVAKGLLTLTIWFNQVLLLFVQYLLLFINIFQAPLIYHFFNIFFFMGHFSFAIFWGNFLLGFFVVLYLKLFISPFHLALSIFTKKKFYLPFFDASGNKNIGTTIRIGWEIQCLPYAGFFVGTFHWSLWIWHLALAPYGMLMKQCWLLINV